MLVERNCPWCCKKGVPRTTAFASFARAVFFLEKILNKLSVLRVIVYRSRTQKMMMTVRWKLLSELCSTESWLNTSSSKIYLRAVPTLTFWCIFWCIFVPDDQQTKNTSKKKKNRSTPENLVFSRVFLDNFWKQAATVKQKDQQRWWQWTNCRSSLFDSIANPVRNWKSITRLWISEF